MSIRLEMLQVARLAPKLLAESTDLVRAFFCREQNADGGFRDRAGQSDLYYTIFGLDGLIGLQAVWDPLPTANYLCRFQGGEGMDFVHLCCLARGWAAVGGGTWAAQKNGTGIASAASFSGGVANSSAAVISEASRREILERIENFRTADGGYNPLPGQAHGTAYGCFLGLAAYQDLRGIIPEPLRLVQCLKFLETPDGAWANERGIKAGSTNATAAAVTLLRQLNLPLHPAVGDWLLAQCQPQGGFAAMTGAPMPDLLSTATSLHALAGMQVELGPARERCLDFVDSLWTNEGGFHGHWADEQLDCEYTFYGLLALGHLSVGG